MFSTIGSRTADAPTAKNGQINSVPTEAMVAQHRRQQEHQLPLKPVGAGSQKAAEQRVLHLCQHCRKEKQHEQNGKLHLVLRPANPSGVQAADAVHPCQRLQDDAHRNQHHQRCQQPAGKAVKLSHEPHLPSEGSCRPQSHRPSPYRKSDRPMRTPLLSVPAKNATASGRRPAENERPDLSPPPPDTP